MFIVISLATLFVVGDHNSANGQIIPRDPCPPTNQPIMLHYSATWGRYAGVCTDSNGVSPIISVTAGGSFPANLTCKTTYETPFNDLPLEVKTGPPLTSTTTTTLIDVENAIFAGNKGIFSYGTVVEGVCKGGAYITIHLYNSQCEPCCECGYCLNTQSTSTSLIMFFGGATDVPGGSPVSCPVWTACTGKTFMGYEDSLTYN